MLRTAAVCFSWVRARLRGGVSYSFFLSFESQGVIGVHQKEKEWERGVEADCVADSGPEVPLGLVSSTNDFVAKQAESFDNLGEGSKWVLNHILEFCEKMSLEVKGKEADLFDFLFALETSRKKPVLRGEEEVGDEGERLRSHGG